MNTEAPPREHLHALPAKSSLSPVTRNASNAQSNQPMQPILVKPRANTPVELLPSLPMAKLGRCNSLTRTARFWNLSPLPTLSATRRTCTLAPCKPATAPPTSHTRMITKTASQPIPTTWKTTRPPLFLSEPASSKEAGVCTMAADRSRSRFYPCKFGCTDL